MAGEPEPEQTHRCPECGNPLVKADPIGTWTCLRCGSFYASPEEKAPL